MLLYPRKLFLSCIFFFRERDRRFKLFILRERLHELLVVLEDRKNRRIDRICKSEKEEDRPECDLALRIEVDTVREDEDTGDDLDDTSERSKSEPVSSDLQLFRIRPIIECPNV